MPEMIIPMAPYHWDGVTVGILKLAKQPPMIAAIDRMCTAMKIVLTITIEVWRILSEPYLTTEVSAFEPSRRGGHEAPSIRSIYDTVVISLCSVQHVTNSDGIVTVGISHDHRSFDNIARTKNCYLRLIDHWRVKQSAERA